MSGIFLLDWAALCVSLFNTTLLAWLGLTVWLTSERRTWGIHLTGSGLLLGSAFFVCHSLILALGFQLDNPWLQLWWRAGWFPVVLSPIAWYTVVLWYAGFWERPHTSMHRRQAPFLILNVLFATFLVALLFLPHSLPDFNEITYLNIHQARPALLGIPLPILLLPAYILLCLFPALDALLRPGPTRRPMGDAARRRARPWLLVSSLILLIVSILVGWVMVRVVWFSTLLSRTVSSIVWFALHLTLYDILIAGLIGLSVLCLGQALVSYEIFTGKVLPRQGLRRYYRNAILLFAGISLLVSAAYSLRISAIYSLMLALMLAAVTFSLLTWRSFVERDWTIRQLRPFVASQRIYDRALIAGPAGLAELDLDLPFRALCIEVLDASRAALVALGPLAPFAVRPLIYPPGHSEDIIAVEPIAARFTSPDLMLVELDPETQGGFALAIPLWNERGLIGALLLGEKNGRSFYTQEEIEVARASGERLVDTMASVEIVRRLSALQRERMVAGQVLDRQTRRVLHDEILPALHTTLLQLGGSHGAQNPEVQQAIQQLSAVHRQVSALLRDLPVQQAPALARLGLLGALQQMVEQDLAGPFDQASWSQDESAANAACALPPLTTEVVYYAVREAVRNAARHARGDQPLHLRVSASGQNGFQVSVEDNGIGMEAGLPTADGAGQGLSLHTTLMAVVGGSLAVESKPGAFTKVIVRI